MVVFHDIALKQPDPTSNVRAFWDEIKAGFRFTEIIDDHDQLGFGLGVLEV